MYQRDVLEISYPEFLIRSIYTSRLRGPDRNLWSHAQLVHPFRTSEREKVTAANGNRAVAYYAGNKTLSCEHTSTC